MPRRTIPVKDKELVKAKLAAGASLTKAVEGTDIDRSTAHVWVKNEFDDIRQLRQHYVQKMRELGADETFRAEKWVEMAQHPDWQARKEALKYIDQVVGLSQENTVTNNITITPIYGAISVQRHDGDTPDIQPAEAD